MVSLSAHAPHIVQWIDYWSLFTLVGLLACRAWLIPEHLATAQTTFRQWHRGLAVSLTVMTCTSLALLVARTAAMSTESFSSAVLLVPSVLQDTYQGRVWILRLTALSCIWLGWKRSASFDGFDRTRWFTFASVCVLALSYGAMSHAAASDDPALGIFLQATHLLFAAAWGGGILIFTGLILPALKRSGSHSREKIVLALRRLSGLALVCMTGIIITGTFNAWRMLGSANALWGSEYGRTLATKILFMLAMVAIGALCRYRILPALMRADGTTALTFKEEVSRLRKVLAVDRWIVLVLLFVVADLVHIPPSIAEVANRLTTAGDYICRSAWK